MKKPLLGLLFLVGLFMVPTNSTFAAPIAPGSFSTTWNTGSSDNIQIGLENCATSVYWEQVGNDLINGTSTDCTGGVHTVTFPVPGEYRVDFSGSFSSVDLLYFPGADDREEMLKLRTVEQWGDSQWSSFTEAFWGAIYLTVNATDAPDLSQVTNTALMFADTTSFNSDISHWDMSNVIDLWGMFWGATSFNQDISGWDMTSATRYWRVFRGATSFNQDISGWNMAAATDMSEMFSGATAFNQDLGSWNVANVEYMSAMFNLSGLSKENYTSTLQGWASLPSLQNNVTLGAQNITHAQAATTARQFLIDTYNWTINDAGLYVEPGSQTFITRWDTSLDPETPNELNLYLPSSASAFTVDWGDGTTQYYAIGTDDYVTHTYSTPGVKTVTITGNFPHFYAGCYDGDANNKLIDVVEWGTGQWESFAGSFAGCTYLEDFSATDVPNLSQVTDMSEAFIDAANFNGDIGEWDVSNVSEMSYMFYGAATFNSDISGWNVASLTNMFGMFWGASAFNQDVSRWDPPVTDMYNAFLDASSFNQNISSWNVTGLTQASNALSGTALSASNYTKLLLAWSAQDFPDSHSSPSLDNVGGTYDADLDDYLNLTTYCSVAQNARDIMTGTYNWSITDGGPVSCQTATYAAGEGGSLTGATSQYIPDGESGTPVTAMAAEGYRFVSWSDGVTTNPRTDSNLTGSISVTAKFSAGGSGESTKIGERAEQIVEAIKTMPAVGSISKFVSSVRDFLTYLTESEDQLETITPAERTTIIMTLRDILAFLMRMVPGA